MRRRTIRNQRHLTPFPTNPRLPNRCQHIPLRHLPLESIQLLILNKTNWIIATDRTFQQPLGVIWKSRRDHRHRRYIRVPILWSVRMGRPHLQSRSRGSSENNRYRILPTTHITDRPRVVHDLIIRHHRKTPGHELHHGSQPLHRRPHPQARKT